MMLPTYQGVVQQGHIRLPAGTTLPDGMRVIVTLMPTVDEASARRTANLWLGENVGNLVMADQAAFVDRPDGRTAWRFGAFVTSLSHSPFGPVGYVEVDASTGTVLATDTLAEEIASRGERLECAPLPTAS